MSQHFILSIETSTPVCAVALHSTGGELLAANTLFSGRSHAERLLSLVQDLLAAAQVRKQELAAIAVSAGPGSYTGLRIGSTTAKGLSYALGIPLIAISTLEAMAQGMQALNPMQAWLAPMLDARRMEVYTGIWDSSLHNIKPVAPLIVTKESFLPELEKQPIVFFGDGAPKCAPVLKHRHAHFIEGNQSPSAISVGALAVGKFQQKVFVDVAYFEPSYLKDFMIKPAKDKLRMQ